MPTAGEESAFRGFVKKGNDKQRVLYVRELLKLNSRASVMRWVQVPEIDKIWKNSKQNSSRAFSKADEDEKKIHGSREKLFAERLTIEMSLLVRVSAPVSTSSASVESSSTGTFKNTM